jgi:hypothetical protein
MNPEFVPYELAVALKKQGFDKPCFAVYEDKRWQLVEVQNSMSYDLCVKTDTFPAPTLSQALRWFRETYNLHHEILLDQTTQPKYCFEINRYMHFGNWELVKNPDWCLYRIYEEAQLYCLVKLIEIVKNADEKHT